MIDEDEDRFLDLAPSNKLGEIRLEISYVQKGGTTQTLNFGRRERYMSEGNR